MTDYESLLILVDALLKAPEGEDKFQIVELHDFMETHQDELALALSAIHKGQDGVVKRIEPLTLKEYGALARALKDKRIVDIPDEDVEHLGRAYHKCKARGYVS